MAGVLERWGHVLLACAVGVPVLVAVVAVRARVLAAAGPAGPAGPVTSAGPVTPATPPGAGRVAAAGTGRRVAWRVAIAEVGAIAGTLPWLWMILTPLPQPGAVHPVPFQEVPGYLAVPLDEAVVQIGGNLAVFAAFGALAPVRWRLGLLTVVASAAAGSVAVELSQWALDLGRVTSVDDVLLNTLGATGAALVTRPWWRARREPPLAAGTS